MSSSQFAPKNLPTNPLLYREQDKDATVYIGNIDERAAPDMVYEIMLQMGSIQNIHMPRDRVTQSHQGFGFVEFRTPTDAEYAANVMNGVKLYGKSLRVNKASADKQKTTDIGAELFVGNLDPSADEKILYDTFSRFGPLLSLPKVARDDNGGSKGFGFISFGDFESSDAAIDNLNSQYILSNQVTVQYAFKKDGKGERHGDEAERQLAAQAKKRNIAPEAQAMPPAFLNGPPQQQQQQQQQHQQSQQHSQSVTPTPPAPAGFAPPSSSMPPGMPTHSHGHGQHAPPPAGFAPPPARGPSPYNAGMPHQPPPAGVAAGRGGSVPLPPPPSGLPARPPQSQGAYTNPADFHPGAYRPPSGSPAPPPGFHGAPPPPGFQGAGGAGGGPPPPPGFMPPPGFQQQQQQQQHQQPPPGYPQQR